MTRWMTTARVLMAICGWGMLGPMTWMPGMASAAPAVSGQPVGIQASSSSVAAEEFQHVEQVNIFFNRLARIPDRRLWGQDDYWATPAELLRMGGGDCEDMAAAKYFMLRGMGVPAERLRLVYARVFDSRRRVIEPHMVLWYRYDAASEWRVLDSLTPRIQRLSQRADLLPRLAFNEYRVAYWRVSEGETHLGGPELIDRWQVLLQRQQTSQNLASTSSDPAS